VYAAAILPFLAACTGGGSGYPVPMANITVDGDVSDWPDTKPAIRDPVGDRTEAISGGDIIAIYVAQDDSNIYIRIELESGPLSSALGFNVSFEDRDSEWDLSDWFVTYIVEHGGITLNRPTSGENAILANGTVATSESTIEMSVPRNALQLSEKLYVSATSSVQYNDRVDYAAEDGVPVLF
jgi:hypothetical protein